MRMFRAGAMLAVLSCLGPAAAPARTPIDERGAYLHRPANAVFHAAIGLRLVRTGLAYYDDAGDDVMATYEHNGPQGRVVVSINVYPERGTPGSARDCDSDFASTRRGWAGRLRDARAISEAIPGPLDGVDPAMTRRATYLGTMEDGREIRIDLVAFCHVGGAWTMSYMLAGPPTLDPVALMTDMARLGPWPGRGPALPTPRPSPRN